MRALAGKSASWFVDGMMCNMMNAIQWRRREDASTRDALAIYLEETSRLSREEYFRVKPAVRPMVKKTLIEWDTPHPTIHPENNRARVLFFPAPTMNAPVVLILHALMSASDIGYRRLAAWFNDMGWSVAFPHLPYHYSRTPRRHWNGELAITADLVRNAEGIRQGVVELRQLMMLLRTCGVKEFGLIGTSYGGWTGGLLSLLEKDFRFVALVQPIINTDKAIWENPGARVMRRKLRSLGHQRGNTSPFDHLVSALRGYPLCDPSKIIITAGLYDRISPIEDLECLAQKWQGARLITVPQGHFGYRALRETINHLSPSLVA